MTQGKFCHDFRLDPQAQNLAWTEHVLIETIGFATHVHTPYTSALAIFKLLGLEDSDQEQEIKKKAMQFVLDSYKSKKVVFCYTPAQTAIAAVQSAFEDQNCDVVAKVVSHEH